MVEARRESWRANSEEATEEAWKREDEIEDHIAAAPVSGVVGLAINAYLVAHLDADFKPSRLGNDPASLDPENISPIGRAFAEAAAAFMPELWPLVAGVVDAEVVGWPDA